MMNSMLVALLACLVSTAFAGLAVDNTAALTDQQYNCLNNSGVDVVITRIYDPVGKVDKTGLANMENAFNSGVGFDGYDVYFAPCLANCQNGKTSGADQVNAAINELNADFEDLFFWVQVDPSQPWSSDKSQNQQFLMDVVNTAVKENQAIGIQANYSTWSKIFGSSFTQLTQQAKWVWWVDLNGKADLTTNWTPFGGWTAPFFHQYQQTTSNTCASGVSLGYSYWNDKAFMEYRKTLKPRKINRKINPKFAAKH